MSITATRFSGILASLVFVVGAANAHASPEITFANSFYKTSSGAIGPHRIIATQTYRVQVGGVREIIIDRIISGRREFSCEPVRLKADSGKINLTISAAIQQKLHGGVTYIAVMKTDDNETYTCEARELPENSSQPVEPAMIIFAQEYHSSFKLIKDEFDQEHSQYNK